MTAVRDASFSNPVLVRLIDIARKALDMDVVWVSEIVGGEQVFRAVSASEAFPDVAEGYASAYDGSYCRFAVDNNSPFIVRDTRTDSRTNSLPITDRLGIRSYVGIPISRSDGRHLGMLCFASRSVMRHDPSMRPLEALALAAGEDAEARLAQLEALDEKRERITRTIVEKRLDVVVQPIVCLSTMRMVGVEALTRFHEAPARPDVWFADAAEVGLGEDLELLAIESALKFLPMLPGNAYLSLNVSPRVAIASRLAQCLLRSESSRLVLEITEHSAVVSYDDLLRALGPLRKAGVRLAVDDAGAGFASFNHILTLHPDIIKLDTHLTRNLDQDPVRFSLAESLAQFATRMRAQLVAEGVETQSELDALLRTDAYAVQGYLIGRPGPMPPKEITVRPSSVSYAGTRGQPALHDDTTVEDYVHGILRSVIAETGLDIAYVTVFHAQEEMLEHRYVYPAGGVLSAGLTIPWRDSLCKRCRDAEIIWSADIGATVEPGSYADGSGVKTYLSMPIRTPANLDTFGTLCAAGFEHRYLSERAVLRVEMLARLIADRIVRDGVERFMLRRAAS